MNLPRERPASPTSRSPRRNSGPPALLLALSAMACGGDAGPWGAGSAEEHRPAEFHLELAIGEGLEEPREHQFVGIRDIEVGRDGTIWVLDGEGPTALLRQFDPEGRFLRTVGGVGEGPGEYLAPVELAMLPDGRVALRDSRALDRITLYGPDGTLDGSWRIEGWSDRGGYPLVVADTGGVLWVRFQGPRRPTPPPRPPPVFVRVRPDGTFLDTVPRPTPPQVPRDTLSVVRRGASGSLSSTGVTVPYQPSGTAVLGPAGAFAVYRTDRYRVEILPPVAFGAAPEVSGSPAPEVVISRDVRPVTVSEAERRALRATMEAELKWAVEREGGGGGGVAIPEVPRHKPPLKHVRFGEDGRVWVSVSVPSVRREGEWMDPTAFDVFEPDGTFLGRVHLPEGFSVLASRGDHAWGVLRGEFDVESVRRYRIEWR